MPQLLPTKQASKITVGGHALSVEEPTHDEEHSNCKKHDRLRQAQPANPKGFVLFFFT
jgi:hypothetical protein